MNYCQTCRKENDFGTNFCRYCGHLLAQPQQQVNQPNPNEYVPPRPYVWKTDEYQVNNYSAPKTQEVQRTDFPNQPNFNQNTAQTLIQQRPNNNYLSGYRCPRCGTHNLPYRKRQISTAGWITFAVLLVTTGIFFWIGLLIKEDVNVCSVCNNRVNS